MQNIPDKGVTDTRPAIMLSMSYADVSVIVFKVVGAVKDRRHNGGDLSSSGGIQSGAQPWNPTRHRHMVVSFEMTGEICPSSSAGKLLLRI